MINSDELTAQLEPFDSFWEGPADVEKGYSKFSAFYSNNYLNYFPKDSASNILVVSCGPGYIVELLKSEGYTNVLGIDSTPTQIEWTKKRDLNCKVARAFEFLGESSDDTFDVIFCEQEVNHLTKRELMNFLPLVYAKLKPGGVILCHSLNGANPITGSEALAQNFDHYNTFTEYTFEQVLQHCGYEQVKVYPLNLYVFWKNPANYLLLAITGLLHLLFRACFIMYGKANRLFTKKIGAVGQKPL